MKKRSLVLSTLLAVSMTASAGVMPAAAYADSAEATVSENRTEAAPSGPSGSSENGGEAQNGREPDHQTPPEKPSRDTPGSQKGQEKSSGDASDSQFSEGNPPSDQAPGGNGLGQGGGPGGAPGSEQSVTYSAVNEYSSADDSQTLKDQKIESTGTDENAVLVDGNCAEVTLDGGEVTRTSDDSDSGNTSSFYGNSAALLATGGTLNVKGTSISTDAQGGAGAFAYGGGTVNIADSTIKTKKGTSGGIHVAGGGKLNAWDLNVTTNGESSAAIRSDRGGGTMAVNGGTYETNGTGSPAIYSTADITVNKASLTANNSEAACIEGLNTIRLFDCDLTGDMPTDNDQNEVSWNVIVYQSMSGDSEQGNGTFEMSGGSLTAKSGGMFYTTNTESTFVLDNVSITPSDSNDFFLRCTGNSNGRGWGTAGKNGADCTFTSIDQEMTGDVIWDQISNLDFYMTKGSTLTGAVTRDDTYSGGSGDGYCNLYIDRDSTWVVTGDSVLTSLSSAGKIVDRDGKTVSIVGSDGTQYVKGDSDVTVTVDSYSDDPDMSGASTADNWSDFEQSKPAALT